MAVTTFPPSPAGTPRGDGMLVVSACMALALGLLVYVADRDPSRAWLLPAFASTATPVHEPWFGLLGQWLPSAVHPFAFGLLSAALLPVQGAARPAACVAWALVNALFELGQHPLVIARVAHALQATEGPPWLIRPLSNYFVRGTFDVGDLAATALGALLALGLLHLAQRTRETDHAC
jgi:hypothetical protein